MIAAHDSPPGSVVDDHSFLLRDQNGQRKLRHQKYAFEIDMDLLVPFFLRAFDRCLWIENSRVVKEDVEPAEGPHSLIHCALAVGRDANIGPHEQGVCWAVL